MDTQTVFNIFFILAVVAWLVRSIMRISGLVKNQCVGGGEAATVYMIATVIGVIGWGIFLILSMFAGDFVLDKITFLFGW